MDSVKGPLDKLDQLEHQVLEVHMEIEVTMAHPGKQDLKEKPDQLEELDYKEYKESTDVLDHKELQDHQEDQERLDQWDLLDFQVNQVSLATKV